MRSTLFHSEEGFAEYLSYPTDAAFEPLPLADAALAPPFPRNEYHTRRLWPQQKQEIDSLRASWLASAHARLPDTQPALLDQKMQLSASLYFHGVGSQDARR